MRLAIPNLMAVALQCLAGHGLHTSRGSHLAPPAVCEVDTSKYLLLQQCPRINWPSANSTHPNGIHGADTHGTVPWAPVQSGSEAPSGAADEDSEELATSSFMSFEEWKGMMLQKTGQDPADLKERNRREGRDRVDIGPNDILDSWGDDGEIALDFEVLSGKATDVAATASARTGGASGKDDKAGSGQDDGMASYRRPKDAGKTCKERFSYASFDGGATILKTSPGAQNPKSILVENKDAYMLFTCSQENKFVIVELSEDILVDTVVLANFEFFSSTIRSFRVSVSDKYPVKMDKWKNIGTYEARNTREVQSFLVENPKIYAKYIRVEFLSHYGKEYYCPVSLLRVHGTRMLDSWKDVENAVSDDDDSTETVDSPEPVPEPELPQESLASQLEASFAVTHLTSQIPANTSIQHYGISPWHPSLQYEQYLETCAMSTPTTKVTVGTEARVRPVDANQPAVEAVPSTKEGEAFATAVEYTVSSAGIETPPLSSPKSSTDGPARTGNTETVAGPTSGSAVAGNKTQAAEQAAKAPVTPAPGSNSHSSTSKTLSKQSPTSNARRNSTATGSSAAASPTIQESFFKSMSKRIGFLEGNVTLLAQYIDEQSKFLQDALQKMERRQIKRVDDFLHHLNQTVLGDIVVNLESHRQIVDRHDRQILALSSQLSVLAGDVGLLKLMMIILIVLIVFLILLVLMSCGVQSGSAEQWAAASGQIFNTYLGSPRLTPGSPQSARGSITPTQRLLRRQNAGPAVMMRHSSNGSATGLHPGSGQRSASGPTAASLMDKALPMTPMSDVFDRSEDESGSPTPPSSRKVLRPPPQIRVEEADDLFEEEKRNGGGDKEYLNKKSRPLIEEIPTPMEEPSTPRSTGERAQQSEGEYDAGDAYEVRGEPSKPPLTRSPLSELGGSSRKPLPSLAEDPT